MLIDADSKAKANALAQLLGVHSNQDERQSTTGRLYGICDSALISGLWVDLETGRLPYLPLYDGDFEKIAEAIPYVIQFDFANHRDDSLELLSHIGKNAMLFIQSQEDLTALTQKLRYFYHVKLRDGKSGLRRFFDARFFSNFIKNLNPETREKLFLHTDFFAIESNKKEENQQFIDFYSRTEVSLDIKTHELLIPVTELD